MMDRPVGARCLRTAFATLALLVAAETGADSPNDAARARLQDLAGYLDVLRDVAGGRGREAVEALVALHSEPWTAAKWLAAARELSAEAPECLVPIVHLHLGALAVELRKGDRVLVLETLDFIHALVDLYRERRDAESREKGLDGDLVLLEARILRDARYLEEALEPYEDAAARLPEAAGVRLEAAAVAEKLGRYREAASHLREVLDVIPGEPEARLRLALVDARRGRAEAATKALHALLGDDVPAWIAIVAHQELARLLAADDSRQEAQAVLRAGRDRFPADPHLAIALLASLQPSSREALELLAALSHAEPAGTGPTARLQYNLWSDAATPRLRELQRAIDARRPLLGRALEARASADPRPE